MGIIKFKKGDDTFIGSLVVHVDGEEAINQGAVNVKLDCGETYIIPEGYHDGFGVVAANTLETQTKANAIASNILNGKTAWINGNKIIGEMPNNKNWIETPVFGTYELKDEDGNLIETYENQLLVPFVNEKGEPDFKRVENGKVLIPEGYHDGNGYVNTNNIYNKGIDDGIYQTKNAKGFAQLIIKTSSLHPTSDSWVAWTETVWTNDIADGRVYIRCKHHSKSPYTDWLSYCYVGGTKVSQGYKNDWAVTDTVIKKGQSVVFKGGQRGGVEDCIVFFYIP